MGVTTDARCLVINADDFGLSVDINRGIMEAFAAGSLRSTSIMVSMPGFDDAVDRAKAAGNALGVGLHFTLTSGRPLTSATSLVDHRTGEFLRIRALLVRAFCGRVRVRDVEEECEAQIARARAAGLELTHLDGHHHVHLLPTIREAVRRVVHAERIPVVRRPVERIVAAAGMRRMPTRVVVAALALPIDQQHWDVCVTDHFMGLIMLGAAEFHRLLLRALDAIAPGSTEVMVHPGYVAGALPAGDSYTTEREMELRALTSPEVLSRLQSGRIRLMHFGELAASLR